MTTIRLHPRSVTVGARLLRIVMHSDHPAVIQLRRLVLANPADQKALDWLVESLEARHLASREQKPAA